MQWHLTVGVLLTDGFIFVGVRERCFASASLCRFATRSDEGTEEFECVEVIDEVVLVRGMILVREEGVVGARGGIVLVREEGVVGARGGMILVREEGVVGARGGMILIRDDGVVGARGGIVLVAVGMFCRGVPWNNVVRVMIRVMTVRACLRSAQALTGGVSSSLVIVSFLRACRRLDCCLFWFFTLSFTSGGLSLKFSNSICFLICEILFRILSSASGETPSFSSVRNLTRSSFKACTRLVSVPAETVVVVDGVFVSSIDVSCYYFLCFIAARAGLSFPLWTCVPRSRFPRIRYTKSAEG